MNITGLDHIYLTVSDFGVSERFYDDVMEALGFRKGDSPIGGDPHAHYIRPTLQISIRPAKNISAKYDAYSPGLHHLCLQAASNSDIDEAYEKLIALGIEVTAPALYPEYHPEYYATFFEDPDGLRLEVVARTPQRDIIANRWDEMRVFLNPVKELLSRRN
ncbi:MAG: VOC family protein [Pseudomonadota bacterium]